MTEYRLLTNLEELSAACEELSRHAALGFDTETTSLDPYAGRLRLIQLAAPDRPVYLFDLDQLAPNGDATQAPALAPLRELLAAARPVKIAHNCLAGDMLVSMADGTKVRIDKLVRAKIRGQVLCIDEQTGTLSAGDIIGWVDGGIRPWDDWLRIRMRGKGRLRVTKDHQILTERGRIRAENLLLGDKVLTSLPELSPPQRDVLYGSLLGDGSLTKQRTAQSCTPHFKVSHSLRQEGYIALKAAALDGLVKLMTIEKVHDRGFSNSAGGSQLISLTTKSDPRLFEFYDNCLMGGKRTLTPRWLDNLSMPAMAVWYCDDGTLTRGSSASICVSALGTAGAELLVEFLRGKGFPAKLWTRTDGQLYVKVVGPYGRGMSEELKRFWESIALYVPVSMQDKLPVAYKHLASDSYWTTTPAQSKAFSDIVVEILPLLNDSSERGRYDGYRRGKRRGLKQYCLTVATQQNFVAGGLAVSNCKFDAKWTKHMLGVELGGLFDTLLASQLVSAGETEDRHSLAVVTERYLGQTVDKTEQLSDWSGELSASQLDYAARDAAVMLPLREALIKRLKSDDLIKVAQIEFECVMPVAELELAGIFLDTARWREQIAVVKKARERVAAELQAMLAVGTMQASLFADARADINIDSHTQLSAALKRLGVPVPDSTRNWKLQPLAAEWPVVAKLLEYRTMQKSLTSYGENINGEINPKTGRIHANFHQIGAPTGRMACNSPNIQQVPHAIEYRRCFRAPEGRKLCIADFSQIELRILAHVTGDQGFIDAFNSGADLHRVTAAQVFNVPLDQVTREQRDFAKRLNFGVVYGIGAQRFSMLTGLPLTEAENIMARYFQTYRTLDAWLREAARKAVRERQARTLSGRLNRFNFDPEDRQAVSLVQRNGKNMPIQGCVKYDSRILTESDGYVQIGQLAGKKVRVWDGNRFVAAQVGYSGKKQLVKVEFWGGLQIECSPEHKFFTTDVNGRTSWRTPSQFVKGNYVKLTDMVGCWSAPLQLPLPVAKRYNSRPRSVDAIKDKFDLGVWLGRVASDGNVNYYQVRLFVAEHEENILSYLEKLCAVIGHTQHSIRITQTQPQRLHCLVIASVMLTQQLLALGIKTRVPDCAWKDSQILAGYLRGMFDGDGTVTPDGPALCFGQGRKHLAWAREIQQALLLFGIEGRINVGADRINVCVRKRDARLFAERVGLINPLKQSKVRNIYSLKPEGQIYGRAMRIKSIEVTDEWVEMYDVIDSETGRFMANGLITHNSSADILKRALRLLHDKLRDTDACLVNIVHDEIVVEANEKNAAEIAGIIEDAMCRAGAEFITRVPIKVEAQVADEWVK